MIQVANPAAWLAGYIPDLPTPFDESDGIDLTAFAKLCERQIEADVAAIVVGETAGEAATLRFAVTLDNADRLAVMAIAGEIDRLGPPHDSKPDFSLFRRTSTELCAAIQTPNELSPHGLAS